MGDYIITTEQIDSVWRYARVLPHGDGARVRHALTMFNIVPCEECGGSGTMRIVKRVPDTTSDECPCLDCDGHGWVMEANNE